MSQPRTRRQKSEARRAEAEVLTNAIGGRLQVQMTKQKVTSYQLARICSVGESTIRRILDGKNVSVATLYVIACALDCPLEALVSPAQFTQIRNI